jgi:ribosomal protein S18 acetylase RimI-like enzyme
MDDAGDGTEIRRARPEDAAAIAEIYLGGFHATYEFPLAHTDDEVRGWVAAGLLPATETWVATHADEVVGFVSLGEHGIEQLYVAPGRTGRGIGTRLVELAKDRRPAGLRLHTFQVNGGARRFYERHGFRAVGTTDGSSNEERQPDIEYAWGPAA